MTKQKILDAEPYTPIDMAGAVELGIFDKENKNLPALFTIEGENYDQIKTYCQWFASQRVQLMQKAFSQNQNPELKFWMQSRHHALCWYMIMETWFEKSHIIKTDIWNGLPCSTATSQNIIRDAIDLELIVVLAEKDGRKDRVFPTRKTVAAFISYCNFARNCGKKAASKINKDLARDNEVFPILREMDIATENLKSANKDNFTNHLKHYFKKYV